MITKAQSVGKKQRGILLNVSINTIHLTVKEFGDIEKNNNEYQIVLINIDTNKKWCFNQSNILKVHP